MDLHVIWEFIRFVVFGGFCVFVGFVLWHELCNNLDLPRSLLNKPKMIDASVVIQVLEAGGVKAVHLSDKVDFDYLMENEITSHKDWEGEDVNEWRFPFNVTYVKTSKRFELNMTDLEKGGTFTILRNLDRQDAIQMIDEFNNNMPKGAVFL